LHKSIEYVTIYCVLPDDRHLTFHEGIATTLDDLVRGCRHA
jgi:hypothetical protein